MMTMGSRIHAICTPRREDKMIIPRIKNLGRLSILLVASFGKGFFFLKAPAISIVAPRGHIHPQKNLPNIRVRNIITIEKAIPLIRVLSLSEVIKTIKGFILKKVSGGNIPLRGYVVDQSI